MLISRRRVVALFLGLVLATLAPLPLVRAQTTHSTTVTFLLVNDIYQMSEQVMADGKARGGFARLAAVVKTERAKGGHVIFAHGGDTLSPSLMSSFDRGAHIMALTNMIPPDVFVPGNHEFDFGKAVFLQRMDEARFPIYAANLRAPDGSALPGIKDRAMLTLDGVRIGIAGATFEDTPRASSPEDLQFAPTVPAMRAQAQALRGEGADFLLAVAHIERRAAQDLYASRAFDLILTGHSHDLFAQFDERAAMAEASYDAHYLVAVDVAITVTERDGRRQTEWWPQFRIVDTAAVTPDAAVAMEVAKYEAEFTREMDVALGSTAVELDSRSATVRTGEAAIGALFADAMRVTMRADVAVMNGGGVRAGKVYPPGSTITRRDVLAELPFSNRVVVIEIAGAGLKAAIENGLAQLPEADGRFPQVSGMAATYDASLPPGSRVLTMTVGGAPLDPARIYRVAINDFLARGGDGYDTLRDAKRITPDNDAPLLANEVMTYVRGLGTVRVSVEGRMVAR
jgi:2',3'-cyclic-nucleotide 2'-phosphodiesterase (5'-nucleotidase family)